MYRKLFFLFIALLIVLSQRNVVRADWMMNKNGDLVYISSQVLGEKDEKKPDEKKDNGTKKTDTSKVEGAPGSVSKDQLRPSTTFTISRAPLPPEMEKRNGNTSDGEIGRMKGEPARAMIKKEEIQKLRLERSDAKQIKVEIEEKKGKKREERQKEFEIETENKAEPLRISSSEVENEVKIKKGTAEAKMRFPLSVDPVTKVMTVTTPEGIKPVTILPDKAAEVISKLNIIDNTSNEAKMELGTENGELVYKIEGQKDKKLFGVLPVSLKKDVIVSAQTGNLVRTNESFFTKVLNFLSF